MVPGELVGLKVVFCLISLEQGPALNEDVLLDRLEGRPVDDVIKNFTAVVYKSS